MIFECTRWIGDLFLILKLSRSTDVSCTYRLCTGHTADEVAFSEFVTTGYYNFKNGNHILKRSSPREARQEKTSIKKKSFLNEERFGTKFHWNILTSSHRQETILVTSQKN